jgi:hypothetical protein
LTARSRQTTQRVFGEENRRRMIEEYLSSATAVTPATAWQHVYRLLLWIDRTTGLAHCYESDKAQPGRHWYSRSLVFHDWLSRSFGCLPQELGSNIDLLFSRATDDLARFVVSQEAPRKAKIEAQRRPYEGRDFPLPGEEPAVESMVQEELSSWLTDVPTSDAMRRLSRRLRSYFGQENKRKNLVGEGFEDVLAMLIERMARPGQLKITPRVKLHSLTGFTSNRKAEKARKVDLVIERPSAQRVLVSAKWSVRGDREEQYAADFEAYSRLENAGDDFAFVLVTNEFDAARLAAACDRRGQNVPLFRAVVHVNPDGPLAVYGAQARGAGGRLDELLSGGRLVSLHGWLNQLLS